MAEELASDLESELGREVEVFPTERGVETAHQVGSSITHIEHVSLRIVGRSDNFTHFGVGEFALVRLGHQRAEQRQTGRFVHAHVFGCDQVVVIASDPTTVSSRRTRTGTAGSVPCIGGSIPPFFRVQCVLLIDHRLGSLHHLDFVVRTVHPERPEDVRRFDDVYAQVEFETAGTQFTDVLQQRGLSRHGV